MNQEADEISPEDLEAAGRAHDILEAEGWEGWARRNEEAARSLGGPAALEGVRRSFQ